MIRKRKKFEWPRKLYDKPRILEENKLVATYGLKNKKEIWKAEAKIKYFRTHAKSLHAASEEEQQAFFAKLNTIGLNVHSLTDVLALNKEDLLKRRLPSVLVAKNLANTPKQARQMVVHKRITIKGNVVNIPSYLVRINEESAIAIKQKVKQPKQPAEETPAEPETETAPETQATEQAEQPIEVPANA